MRVRYLQVLLDCPEFPKIKPLNIFHLLILINHKMTYLSSVNALFFICNVFSHSVTNIKSRHELVKGAIGVFDKEEEAYHRVIMLAWILPMVVLLGALLDNIMVFIYMRFAHPWREILFSKPKEEQVKVSGNSQILLNPAYMRRLRYFCIVV